MEFFQYYLSNNNVDRIIKSNLKMMPKKIVAAAGKVLNYGEFELQIHIYGTYGRYCVFTRVIYRHYRVSP
jgi:hypothetical protein